MTVATPSQIVDSIYKSVSSSIINIMQQAQNQAVNSQNINIQCSDDAVSYMNTEVNRCISTLTKEQTKDKKSIMKLCKAPIQCSASNISMKNSLNITNIVNQKANIQSNISNSLTDNIKQSLTGMSPDLITSLLANNSKTSQKIQNVTDLTSSNTQNIIQSVQDYVFTSQTLNLYNYSANNVSISNVSDIIINSVQGIATMQDIVNDISNDISSTLNNTQTSLTQWITYIFLTGLGIIVMLFLFIYFLKRKDTRDFVTMIIPYIILLSSIIIIVTIHLTLKPSYILVQNNQVTKTIDIGKFIFYCFLYSAGIGIIEFVYYKIRKQNNTTPQENTVNTPQENTPQENTVNTPQENTVNTLHENALSHIKTVQENALSHINTVNVSGKNTHGHTSVTVSGKNTHGHTSVTVNGKSINMKNKKK